MEFVGAGVSSGAVVGVEERTLLPGVLLLLLRMLADELESTASRVMLVLVGHNSVLLVGGIRLPVVAGNGRLGVGEGATDGPTVYNGVALVESVDSACVKEIMRVSGVEMLVMLRKKWGGRFWG